MILQEKILYLRKKSGYSQEALAEKLGVSRQAVSKWENGDAEPEIGKLRLLSDLFHVSTDWLLSEDEPVEKEARQVERSSYSHQPHWTENAPGIIGKLIKRYGWLLGVYVAVMGTSLAGIGMLARYMTQKMFSSSFTSPYGDVFGMEGPYGDVFGMQNPFGDIAVNNPVTIMATFFIFVGIIMIIAGIAFAVIMKNKSHTVKD